MKEFIKGRENPFTQSSRTRWHDLLLQVFELEARWDGESYEYRVEIRFAAETRRSSVAMERAEVSGSTVFELADGAIRFFPANGSQTAPLPLETSTSALHLAQLSNQGVQRFVRWLESVHCFRIDEYLKIRRHGTFIAMDEIIRYVSWTMTSISWPDLESWLTQEVSRICPLFSDDGKRLSAAAETVPRSATG